MLKCLKLENSESGFRDKKEYIQILKDKLKDTKKVKWYFLKKLN